MRRWLAQPSVDQFGQPGVGTGIGTGTGTGINTATNQAA